MTSSTETQAPGASPGAVRAEVRAVVRLAVPAVVGQIALTLMGLVDTLMVARLGTEALAATALGAVWCFGSLLPAMGVLFGLDPIVAQAHGARDGATCGRALQHGLWVSLMLSVPIILLWLLTESVLRLAGQDPALSALAHDYALSQCFSAPFFLGFCALRQYLSGRGIVTPSTLVVIVANGVNVVLNWALIFGHLGFDAHGVVGAGIATGLSRVFMCVALAALVFGARLHEEAWAPWEPLARAWTGIRALLAHGIPLGAQVGLEVWGFQLAALCAGRLGADSLAAHSIVLQVASFTFMVPFGISFAAATRVGNLIGAGRLADSRLAAWTSIALGAGFMCLSALGFLLLRHAVPRAFDAEPEVLLLAASIMPIAGAFQVFDGTQAVACGVLRGRGDTKPAAVFNLVGYYVLGIPLGWLLAFPLGMGLPGVWWGLVLGLASVAVLLVLRVRAR